jgi:hypothetical protein
MTSCMNVCVCACVHVHAYTCISVHVYTRIICVKTPTISVLKISKARIHFCTRVIGAHKQHACSTLLTTNNIHHACSTLPTAKNIHTYVLRT